MPDDEVRQLADYGYDTARTTSFLIGVGLQLATPLIEVICYLRAKSKLKDNRLTAICANSHGTLAAYCKTSRVWLIAPLLAISYACAWWLWRQVLLESNKISYESYSMLVCLLYPVASTLCLKSLYKFWQNHNQTNLQANTLDWSDKTENRNNWLLVQCATGLYLTKYMGPSCLLIFYPFVAIRSNLFLSLLLGQKKSGMKAIRTSINLASGNFYKFARIFGLLGALASTTYMAHAYINDIDIWQYTDNNLVALLYDTALDTTQTLIYIYLDALIFLRGLEYINTLSPEELKFINNPSIIETVETG